MPETMTAKEIAQALRDEANRLIELAKVIDPPRRGRPPQENQEPAPE